MTNQPKKLLAATQLLTQTRTLVFYEPQAETALNKVRQRIRIDAALPMPVTAAAIKAVLSGWL